MYVRVWGRKLGDFRNSRVGSFDSLAGLAARARLDNANVALPVGGTDRPAGSYWMRLSEQAARMVVGWELGEGLSA